MYFGAAFGRNSLSTRLYVENVKPPGEGFLAGDVRLKDWKSVDQVPQYHLKEKVRSGP